MSPRQHWMTADGFGHSANKPKTKWSGQSEWNKWSQWETEDNSWACHKCDPFEKGVTDTDEGMLGYEDYCRARHIHKGSSHHMLMAVRANMIKAGTFMSREEARAARLQRLNTTKWIWDWDKGDYVEVELVEEPITIVQAAIKT